LPVQFLGRAALEAQRTIVVRLSRERSLGLYVRTYVYASVCLSSALWKDGGSDPAAVWRRRSDGSRDKAGGEVCRSVHGKGYFGGEFWARHGNQWGLYGIRVRQRRDAAPSQITLGRLVGLMLKYVNYFSAFWDRWRHQSQPVSHVQYWSWKQMRGKLQRARVSPIHRARCYAERCLSYSQHFCLSVCSSHGGIVPKRINVGWCRLYCRVAHWVRLWAYKAHQHIRKGSP